MVTMWLGKSYLGSRSFSPINFVSDRLGEIYVIGVEVWLSLRRRQEEPLAIDIVVD